jgi:hypothetical protein
MQYLGDEKGPGLYASVCQRCLACMLSIENTFYLTRTHSKYLGDENGAGLHVPVYQVPGVNVLLMCC